MVLASVPCRSGGGKQLKREVSEPSKSRILPDCGRANQGSSSPVLQSAPVTRSNELFQSCHLVIGTKSAHPGLAWQLAQGSSRASPLLEVICPQTALCSASSLSASCTVLTLRCSRGTPWHPWKTLATAPNSRTRRRSASSRHATGACSFEFLFLGKVSRNLTTDSGTECCSNWAGDSLSTIPLSGFAKMWSGISLNSPSTPRGCACQGWEG